MPVARFVPAVHAQKAHGRRKRLLRGQEGPPDGVVSENAGLNANHRLVAGNRLQRLVDRGRIGLGVEREAAGEQEDRFLRPQPERGARGFAAALLRRESRHIDAERNHR